MFLNNLWSWLIFHICLFFFFLSLIILHLIPLYICFVSTTLLSITISNNIVLLFLFITHTNIIICCIFKNMSLFICCYSYYNGIAYYWHTGILAYYNFEFYVATVKSHSCFVLFDVHFIKHLCGPLVYDLRSTYYTLITN